MRLKVSYQHPSNRFNTTHHNQLKIGCQKIHPKIITIATSPINTFTIFSLCQCFHLLKRNFIFILYLARIDNAHGLRMHCCPLEHLPDLLPSSLPANTMDKIGLIPLFILHLWPIHGHHCDRLITTISRMGIGSVLSVERAPALRSIATGNIRMRSALRFRAGFLLR